MLKRILLFSLFGLIIWAMIAAWLHYAAAHPSPNEAKLKKSLDSKIKNDPQYKVIQDLQDEKKSITE